MKPRFILALPVVALLLTAAQAATGGDDDLEAAISAGNQDWAQGMTTGNADLAARAYALDALDCGATGECVVGRAAVAAKYKARFAKSGPAKSASVHSKSHVRDGEFAYEWGSADFTGADGRVSSGRFLTVWTREADGSWQICRNIVLP